MSRSPKRVSLTCENLGDRCLLSATSAVQVADINFDASLTASIQTDLYDSQTHVQVDGSDYDDKIQVTQYIPRAGIIKLHLEQRLGGRLISSNNVTLQSSSLSTVQTVQVDAKGGNDQIINSTSAPMAASGGPGDDYISGGSGKDYINGNGGKDTLMGRGGDDFLDGGTEADYIRGGKGNDYILGEDGDDMLYGEDGQDSLIGGTGNDRMYGGGQSDYISGEEGADIIFGDSDNSTQDGNDYIYGGAGNDTIYGGGGNDVIEGDHGNEIALATDGNDYISGGSGDDTIHGNGGDDILNGDNGNDQLFGQDGSDQLFGSVGRDYLDGGYNDPDFHCDLLNGGTGADTFVRHKSFFGLDDADVFADYNEAKGDTTENVWHW